MKAIIISVIGAALCLGVARSALADPPVNEKNQELIDKGLAFLKSKQDANGGWGGDKAPPAVTALVLRAFVQQKQYPYTTDFVSKGYSFLLSNQRPDGGIFKDMLANYNTAIAVSALGAVKDQDAVKAPIEKAVAYLKGLEWTPDMVGPKGEKISDPKYAAFEGGFSYNRHGVPDMSNEHFAIQALHDAGLKPDDPAFKEAIKFITRSQNRSESNDAKFAGNDGGFIYSGAGDGDSEAGSYTGPDGIKHWRSYGTMTYAGIKSMIYAGVAKDDPRVVAAIDWCKKHWTLDENPGLRENDPAQAKAGLYYYFMVMAKALRAYGEPVITDSQGAAHDWRVEMVNKIASLQKQDGSFAGDKRWMEDNPIIVTSYVMSALEDVEADLKEHPAK